jgi:putative PIN family toxin of toxin-antitoxin system
VKSNHRFVFDVNVLVSAALFKNSKPRRAFDKAIDNGTIIISVPVLSELNEVLDREKFKKYIAVEEKRIFLSLLFKEAALEEIVEEIEVCRDPKDDKDLELAVSGKAKFIITGDKDLLVLNPFRGINIVKPEAFLPFDLSKA